MTAVTCAACQSPQPQAALYERIVRSGEFFCKDTTACRRQLASLGDPVGQVAAVPPPVVPGARCQICATVDPSGGVYERSPGSYCCLDRGGCQERAVDYQYLSPWTDASPDRMIAETAGHLRLPAATSAEVVSGDRGPDPFRPMAA
jgi:hypothetical protein